MINITSYQYLFLMRIFWVTHSTTRGQQKPEIDIHDSPQYSQEVNDLIAKLSGIWTQTLTLTSSSAGVTVTLGVLLLVEASWGEVKLKVGKAVVLLIGREMGGRSGNSGTWSQNINRGLVLSGTELFYRPGKRYLSCTFFQEAFLSRKNSSPHHLRAVLKTPVQRIFLVSSCHLQKSHCWLVC